MFSVHGGFERESAGTVDWRCRLHSAESVSYKLPWKDSAADSLQSTSNPCRYQTRVKSPSLYYSQDQEIRSSTVVTNKSVTHSHCFFTHIHIIICRSWMETDTAFSRTFISHRMQIMDGNGSNSYKIRLGSPFTTFYLIQIRIWILIFSNMNTKRMSQIWISIRIVQFSSKCTHIIKFNIHD